MAAYSPTAGGMCNLCRVRPGQLDVRGMTLCHDCLGKTAHMIGLAFTPTCPPLTHCTGDQKVGQSAAASGAITFGMGLFLLAAIAGTAWLYSQSESKGSPMKFGFGLQKSRH